ncbi:MAG TPA: acyl-CoA thioesterase [Chitinophagaceae bacterium]|nr:acyl-CoA thioesterase [Chitinophagaceae bacterium]
MTTLPKVLESTMKIRFHDCDPFNHLNNSRYIDYMVTARGDQLIDAYQFDIYALAVKEKIGWVSAQTQIAYLLPAYLMEEVVIRTQLIHCSEKSLLLEAQMLSLDKRLVKSVMWTRLVHFNLVTQRSQSHTAALMQFFEQVLMPLQPTVNFDERVKQLQAAKG